MTKLVIQQACGCIASMLQQPLPSAELTDSSSMARVVFDWVQVMLQTTAIMGQSINRYAMSAPDVVAVRPSLSGVGSADFSSRQRSIEAGRAAMEAALPKLKAEMVRLRVVAAR